MNEIKLSLLIPILYRANPLNEKVFKLIKKCVRVIRVVGDKDTT